MGLTVLPVLRSRAPEVLRRKQLEYSEERLQVLAEPNQRVLPLYIALCQLQRRLLSSQRPVQPSAPRLLKVYNHYQAY